MDGEQRAGREEEEEGLEVCVCVWGIEKEKHDRGIGERAHALYLYL
jgi:hypothetical protein